MAEFLAQHQTTGEPSRDQLATAKLKLSRGMAHNVLPLPVKPKRAFLPPELLAAAAVVMFAVLAQLIYLATRTPEGSTDAIPGEVTAAYRSGDLAGAQRLASSSCTDANCAALSAKLLRAMELAGRINTLDANELQELSTLDTFLSGGTPTELTVAIEKRKKQGAQSLDTDQLYAEARALSRENESVEALKVVEQCLAIAPGHAECIALKNTLVTAAAKSVETYMSEIADARQSKQYERALMIGEACLAAWPQVADCHRALGSVWAGVATRDQSAAAMDKAKASYQRFLELAPPSDPYVPKVKAILDAAGSTPAAGAHAELVAQISEETKKRNFEEAADLAKRCIAAFPKEPTCYRLLGNIHTSIAARDQNPEALTQAKVVYEAFLALAPPDDEYVPKVRAILSSAPGSTAVPAEKSDVASYVTRISEAVKARNLESAALEGEKCIKAWPKDATCYRWLGSTYAKIAARDQSALDMDKAKRFYEQFVELAPPNDEYVPKVKAILDAALSDARDVYLRGYQLKESSPLEAARLFQQVMRMTPPSDETHQKAKSRIAELRQVLNSEQLAELDGPKPSKSEEEYQRAVALFDTDRTKALELLIKLNRTLPDSDPVKQKAREFVAKSIPQKPPLSPARDTYLRAYQLKDTDPEEAKRLFREVMTMVPPGDETWEKAKNRLAQLEDDKPAANPPSALTVLRGTKKILKYASPIQRVALGDPNVLDVRTIGNNSLEVRGNQRGTTTLLLWMSSGDRISHTVTVK